MVELCDAIEDKKSYEHIDGICYKKDNEIHVGSPRIVSDVNSLPMPSYNLLPMSKYSSIIGLHPTSTMMGSRGCPYKCGFCFKTPFQNVIPLPAMNEGQPFHHKPGAG